MQVRCPHCSTAYEIPPPARPRRLRCARCETEWRELPPAAETVAAPTAVDMPVPVPDGVQDRARADSAPDAADAEPMPAERDPIMPMPRAPLAGASATRDRAGLALWLPLWGVSLAVFGAAGFEFWHARVLIEHRWPEALWLFRLIPNGVPV